GTVTVPVRLGWATEHPGPCPGCRPLLSHGRHTEAQMTKHRSRERARKRSGQPIVFTDTDMQLAWPKSAPPNDDCAQTAGALSSGFGAPAEGQPAEVEGQPASLESPAISEESARAFGAPPAAPAMPPVVRWLLSEVERASYAGPAVRWLLSELERASSAVPACRKTNVRAISTSSWPSQNSYVK